MTDRRPTMRSIEGNLLAGVLTIIPLLVVWIVLNFTFSLLFTAGSPLTRLLTGLATEWAPGAAPILNNDAFQWFVAVIVALALIYAIGAMASRVVGRQILSLFEALIARIPIVQTIYSASKKLITVLQQKPDGTTRVVLIDFPHEKMKTVGLVMRTFPDARTGKELAAVYVPTTPNPTSGYLELVAVEDLIPTDMTMDQAMTMIVSGGAISPETLTFTRLAKGDSPVAGGTSG